MPGSRRGAGSGCAARSERSLVVKRWPSEMRSTSSAMLSMTCDSSWKRAAFSPLASDWLSAMCFANRRAPNCAPTHAHGPDDHRYRASRAEEKEVVLAQRSVQQWRENRHPDLLTSECE
jgi:hypothetical protein